MQRNRIILPLLFVLFWPLLAMAQTEHQHESPESRYVCPMHPQIVRDEPGSCPICGMDLVPVAQAAEPEAEHTSHQILYYRHPHNPGITSPEPRKDEMGMDYVPVYAEAGGDDGIKISPLIQQNMGLRTAIAERDALVPEIETVANVVVDESRISHIHLRVEGWVEKLYVSAVGDPVKKGQLLFEVYAPELLKAEEEYVQALGLGRNGLISSSRERLQLMGMADSEIRALEKNRKIRPRVGVYAAYDGVVQALAVREGMNVKPALEAMSIVDLSHVWLLAQVYEKQQAQVHVGMKGDFSLDGLPGVDFQGQVSWVSPLLDPASRTLPVRLEVDNPEGLLRPGMFGHVVLHGDALDDVVLIPREAVIYSGKQSRVVVRMGESRFMVREVVTGVEADGRIEIRSGLDEGAEVVTSGQFLLDSEAALRANMQKLQGAHQHGH